MAVAATGVRMIADRDECAQERTLIDALFLSSYDYQRCLKCKKEATSWKGEDPMSERAQRVDGPALLVKSFPAQRRAGKGLLARIKRRLRNRPTPRHR